jgi:hydroxymethylpyrimidine/phosphomethylpyrimidine kinase
MRVTLNIIIGWMIFSALTVAGADSCGGAGIQADLAVFSRLGVHGLSVITALTAQNTTGVLGVMDVSPDFLVRQWEAVLSDIPVHSVKTGMLGTASSIEIASRMIAKYRIGNVVVDPVMVSSSGTTLLAAEAVETLKRKLLPAALLVTPNLDEARVLSGVEVHDRSGMETAARRIAALGCRFVLVKGGHLEGDAIDLLYDGAGFQTFRAARVESVDVHGTGCVLSAAITAYLARGYAVKEAVGAAKVFVTDAIANSLRLGKGRRLCNLSGLKDDELEE